jgi:hypothetical protein
MANDDVSRADFDTLCRLQGLVLTIEEAERLFEAFRSLKALLNRIPSDTDFPPEPAFVLAAPGTRLTT